VSFIENLLVSGRAPAAKQRAWQPQSYRDNGSGVKIGEPFDEPARPRIHALAFRGTASRAAPW
jgi:hypothetical protein